MPGLFFRWDLKANRDISKLAEVGAMDSTSQGFL